MGTYNETNRKHVRLAIDSILRQTFTDFEFIICDDGSEIGFYRWLAQYCKKDKRIILLRNDKNHGLAFTLNRCLEYAKGDFIARMDADDISMAARLERQHSFLASHAAYALVGCYAYLFDEKGVWGIRRLPEKPGKMSFLQTSVFIHPAVMIRREVIEELHGYDEQPWKLRVEDYDFFMRMYVAGYCGYNLPETLFAYRENNSSYRKRKLRWRFHECAVRYCGFQSLGVLHGNIRYVVKPLAAGMIPAWVMRVLRKIKYGKRMAWKIEGAVEHGRDCHIKL